MSDVYGDWIIQNLEVELSEAHVAIDRLRKALQSIAENSCCDKCQEAALVARETLKENSDE
jgi:hypothetical protein